MYKKERVLLVLPAFNEEGKIGRVVRKAIKGAGFLDEILVVNDCSTDKTREEAENTGAKVISHERNKGVGGALKTGFDYSIQNGYDITVVAAGDDQDDPGKIEDLIEPIASEGYDFIQGSRYKGSYMLKMPLFRYFTTKSFSFFFSLVVKKRVTDATNGFRAFRTSLLNEIDLKSEKINKYELEPYFMIEALKKGYRFKEVGVPKYWPEGKSYSKMVPFKSWWSISKPMLYSLLRIRRV